jgi:hypothetical protein
MRNRVECCLQPLELLKTIHQTRNLFNEAICGYRTLCRHFG